MRSGLRLRQEAEERRCCLAQVLEAAEAEADRDGAIAVDTDLAELDAIIDSAEE